MEVAARLALGQWFTPPEVADLALALALPRSGLARLRVCDPACGDGVFLSRARAAGISPRRLVGIEIDPATAAQARAAAPGAQVACADLFAADLPRDRFDAVVGNPPYVRQERLGAERKARLRAAVAEDWPQLDVAEVDRFGGRCDLAAAMIARALRMCRPGGRVAMVVSAALLDAGYAGPLWRLVGHAGRVVAVVDAPCERWFADAAVNAVILVLERARLGGEPRGAGDPAGATLCARLRVPTAEAAARVRGEQDLFDVADVRRAGGDGQLAGALRAPPVWFELVSRAGARLVRLDQLAEIRRGVTSGANDVFYLPRARAAALRLEPSLLVPLLRSPRQAGGERIAVDPAALDTVALLAPPDPAALARFPAAQTYLAARAAAAERPTLRARDPWWSLAARPARAFFTKAYAARFVQRLAAAPVVADQRLYALHPRGALDPELLASALNSTWTALAIEALGRASLGEGALEWTVSDAAGLPVLDVRALSAPARASARAALAAMGRRAIGTPGEERRRPDRARLDRALASDLSDLAADAHSFLEASVAGRAARARSAGAGR